MKRIPLSISKYASIPQIAISLVMAALLASSLQVQADSTGSVDTSDENNYSTVKRDDIYITGGVDGIKKQPGSAHLVDEKELEKFEYTDINRVLAQIPGVNVQEEEGYGLRPNIGLRGAHPHRSRKIALMEDGSLIGPAPYSAPAAYYFPMFAKMEGIEVFKGPAAIKYGPNTIGGAINLITRSIPDTNRGRVNVALGENNFSKVHAYYGERYDEAGWMVDGINLHSDGFKKLDTGNDTGFNKYDVTVKGVINSDLYADNYQELSVKLQFSKENSDSTYTGLSEADFKENPYRRYAASDRDHMDAEHAQIMVTHYYEFSPIFSWTSKLYRNEFVRSWSKLSRLTSDTTLSEILADPDSESNADFMKVLRGELNSVDVGSDATLIIGNNDRKYLSQGLQFLASLEPVLFGYPHEIELGLRFHYDEVERNHSEDQFLMNSGELISTGGPTVSKLVNKDSTKAIAFHIQDKIEIDAWTISSGVRLESIHSKRDDLSSFSPSATIKGSDTVVIPGVGAFYQLSPELGLLAGVHKGFTPVGPGQSAEVEPEESTNFEAGFRYYQGVFNTEMIGFYNDYSNIKGVCAFSSGCDDSDVDKEFNGGEAEILGLELSSGYNFSADTLSFPVKFSYTYTDATFASNSESNNPDWGVGDIRTGDLLPYIPKHQFSISSGVVAKEWRVDANLKFIGKRNDTANTEVKPANRVIDHYSVVDLKASYMVNQAVQVYGSIKNVFDKVYVTSLRPYGDRPGIPRQVQIGTKVSF